MRLCTIGRAAVVLVALAGTSCQDQPAAHTTKSDSPQPQAVAAYVCPMRCEGSASNRPGKCPVCEMELERNPEYRTALQ